MSQKRLTRICAKRRPGKSKPKKLGRIQVFGAMYPE